MQLHQGHWIAIGTAAPAIAAAALVAIRGDVTNANIALILVAVVVVLAVGGGRRTAAVAAVSSALAFDFFHTRPYGHLRIASSNDVETTLLLLLIGLVVGHIATAGRHARRSAKQSNGEIRRIYRLANLSARGEQPADLILAAQAELVSLLHLRTCQFEAAPFTARIDCLERSGTISWRPSKLRDGGFELPADGIALEVLGRGAVLGRFVLDPTPGKGVSLEQRVVAIALADQVGAVLAAAVPGAR